MVYKLTKFAALLLSFLLPIHSAYSAQKVARATTRAPIKAVTTSIYRPPVDVKSTTTTTTTTTNKPTTPQQSTQQKWNPYRSENQKASSSVWSSGDNNSSPILEPWQPPVQNLNPQDPC